MEGVGSILDRTVASIQESKMKLKRKQTCVICDSVIEYIPSNPDTLTGSPFDWDTICSELCYFEFRKIQNKKYYDIRIKDIPIKYRDIEADGKFIKENYGKNLFVTGKSGVGKTVLAVGIAKECIKHRKDFKWINYPAFLMELQNMYKRDKESPFDKAEEVANFKGVLFIDDIGAEKMTDWVRQITYFIINEREQRQLPIVITSNFSLEEIANQVDVRISSRISGMCKAMKLTGSDRRLDKQDKEWKTGEPKPSISRRFV